MALVFKCDLCRKEIKDLVVTVGYGHSFGGYNLCGKCGKPVINFLKKKKLIKKDGNPLLRQKC